MLSFLTNYFKKVGEILYSVYPMFLSASGIGFTTSPSGAPSLVPSFGSLTR